MARAASRGKAAGDPGARLRLLASATELFNRKGYAATTVREIVAAAGVTKPVLYYYFRNKEGIFVDLMREALSQFDRLLDDCARGDGSARARLETLAARTLALFDAHIDVARLIFSIYYGPPQGAPVFDMDAYHIRFQEVVLGMVRDGIRRGEFRNGNADDMAWAIIGAVNMAMELHLCHPGRPFGPDALERVLGIVFAGMAPDGAARRPAGRRPAGRRKGEAR